MSLTYNPSTSPFRNPVIIWYDHRKQWVVNGLWRLRVQQNGWTWDDVAKYMNYMGKQRGEPPVFFETKVKNFAVANEHTVLKNLIPSPEATEGFCTAEGKYKEPEGGCKEPEGGCKEPEGGCKEPEGGCKVRVAGREKKMKERRKQQERKGGDEERKTKKGKGKEKEKKGEEEQRTDFLRVPQGTQRGQQSPLQRAENLGQAQTPQRIPQIKINGLFEQFERPEQVQWAQQSQIQGVERYKQPEKFQETQQQGFKQPPQAAESQQSQQSQLENLMQTQAPPQIPRIQINGLEHIVQSEQVRGTQPWPSQPSPKQVVKRVSPNGHIQKPPRLPQAHHSTSSHPVPQLRAAHQQRIPQIPSHRQMGENYQSQQMHQLQQGQRGFERTLPFSPGHQVPGQGLQYIAQQSYIPHMPGDYPVPRSQQQQQPQFFSHSSAARRGHVRYPAFYGSVGDPAFQAVRNFQNLQVRKESGGE
ncbi:hypothetical protein HYFRA_00005112 [Hymenoscyphus fraxineus]|uniref:Uncharacterized protein n=1 Tax=Hymenoscyphus fraxineus TaxID=746836 RepID=A0A9N9L9S3_9HELO|nr:hypothetical protein HYFRA_00005112 [Hymenoscyphus fraxineus]